jgi:hypothetical protein
MIGSTSAFNLLSYIQVFTSVAALAVSAMALRVSSVQRNTAAVKLRLDLFDKRRPIVQALEKLLLAARRNKLEDSIQPFWDFQAATAEAVFLFDEDIATYLKECRDRCDTHMTRREELEDLKSDPRRASDKKAELEATRAKLKEDREWFSLQDAEMRERFAPYMRIAGSGDPIAPLLKQEERARIRARAKKNKQASSAVAPR